MTTLAIIGSGILGRSLLYTLAKEKKSFEKITILSADEITFPCSLHSTAIVAPRGLSEGHSPLGDMLYASFKTFQEHFVIDSPLGIEKVSQWTGGVDKIETIKSRYPHGKMHSSIADFPLKKSHYLAWDEAYMIDPMAYLNWLMVEATKQQQIQIEIVSDLVTSLKAEERIHLTTQTGRTLSFDQVVFAGGYYNHFWQPYVPESLLKTTKPVQGSYLEFNHVPWSFSSFSFTFDGHNMIWNQSLKKLLIGSSSQNVAHVMPNMVELEQIYSFFQDLVEIDLPSFSSAEVKVGIREKAQKRAPYVVNRGKVYFIGGLYKNGYSLSLKMAKDLAHQWV